MGGFIQRFISFDRLIGPLLVKVAYFLGAAAIIAVAGLTLMTAVLSFVGGNISAGLMQLLAVPAVAAVALLYWRFMCELFMLAFLAFERLGEVRDLMRKATGGAAEPEHPAF